MDELILTYPQLIARGGRGPSVFTSPSRFLGELDLDLYEPAILESGFDLSFGEPPPPCESPED